MTDTIERDNGAENELARRRHVNDLATVIAAAISTGGSAVAELHELGLTSEEIVDVSTSKLANPAHRRMIYDMGTIPSALDLMFAGNTYGPGHEQKMVDAFHTMADADPSFAGAAKKFEEAIQKRLDDPPPDDRMQTLIERLFAEAPKLTDGSGRPIEGQAPAIECNVMLGSGQVIMGALSTTPEGMLRLLSPGKDQQNRPILIEQFFCYADVQVIAVRRDVTGSGSSIVPAS
jgi:hypothetical protein